jgi:hypothetical protein
MSMQILKHCNNKAAINEENNKGVNMNTTVSTRFRTAILASAALMAATIAVPQQAKADATFIATMLGGSALLGLLVHANQPILAPRFQRSNALLTHSRYSPMPSPYASVAPYPAYAPVVYASVAPAPMYHTPYRVMQPVRYQVSSPSASAVPQNGVYQSSANMNYPMQQNMQQPVQQSVQQSMIDPMQQPAQAQQMSYQAPAQYQVGAGMPMAQPMAQPMMPQQQQQAQYGAKYSQY